MYSYIVEPLSRFNIRQIVKNFRKLLGIENAWFVDVVALLDILSKKIPDFSYEVVANCTLPKKVFATTDIYSGKIKIKQHIFDKACDGNGFARYCIAHEIGHFILLRLCGFELTKATQDMNIPKFRNPEWQAECFAGELMMGYDVTKHFTVEELKDRCGVSKKAANYQYNMFRKI